jgi:hypothetical protein
MLRGLNDQQRKQILEILTAADVANGDGPDIEDTPEPQDDGLALGVDWGSKLIISTKLT